MDGCGKRSELIMQSQKLKNKEKNSNAKLSYEVILSKLS